MAHAPPVPATVASAPFTAAVAARDIDALLGTLAPDAVLYSPIVRTPFRGTAMLRDLYLSLFEAFDELDVVDELQSGDTCVFCWEGRINGRHLAGADRLRYGSDGKVVEITIYGRPLHGMVTLLAEMGSGFARRRRGTLVGKLLRLGALPLAPLFALLDPVVRWLQAGGRS